MGPMAGLTQSSRQRLWTGTQDGEETGSEERNNTMKKERIWTLELVVIIGEAIMNRAGHDQKENSRNANARVMRLQGGDQPCGRGRSVNSVLILGTRRAGDCHRQ